MLQKDVLKKSLKKGFQKLSQNPNATLADVKKVWNDSYREYALSSTPIGGQPAAVFTPTVGIADSLTGAMGAFVTDIASGLQTFWMSGVWTPDVSFSYVTVNASGFISSHMALTSKDLDDAVDGIASDLHTYTTTMVQLTATNLQSGATSTVLLS